MPERQWKSRHNTRNRSLICTLPQVQMSKQQTSHFTGAQNTAINNMYTQIVVVTVSIKTFSLNMPFLTRVPTPLVTKNSSTLPGPQKPFSGPYRKLAMFKYRGFGGAL